MQQQAAEPLTGQVRHGSQIAGMELVSTTLANLTITAGRPPSRARA
jgi:hypothetical protein